MILFPHVQKRAQKEISRVIGNDRLPNIADRDALPYITQILLETIRWHSVVPTGETSSVWNSLLFEILIV